MKSNKGFTLFELLVSVSIIGILTAIASISFSNAQKKGRDARRMEDMKMIQNAAEMYYSLNSYTYPISTAAPDAWTPASSSSPALERFPTDPKGVGYENPYTYSAVGGGALTGANYCACAYIEGNGGNSDANCGNYGTGTQYFCVKNQQ